MNSNLFWHAGLSETVIGRLACIGFNTPTPIQKLAIPYILSGRDVCACAQTGSGKTAAYLLPVIDQLLYLRKRAHLPRAIVLSPTRELAQQVHENFKTFCEGTALKAALLVGGEWAGEQEKQLRRKPDLIIATPGRLLDLYERGKLIPQGLQTLVIDEADRMLDMGFMPDVKRLLAIMPCHQTILFSATFAPELKQYIEDLLVNPKHLETSVSSSPVKTITQYSLSVDGDDKKRESLRGVLRQYPGTSAIVFCNRKRDVDVVSKSLEKHGFETMAIHGDLHQSVRNQTLDRFRAEQGIILVASDVAARGIDIDNLPMVINFDLPINPEDYIHRIGRTGRAGRDGLAFSLINKRDQKTLKNIVKLMDAELAPYHLPVEKKKELPQRFSHTSLSSFNAKEEVGFGGFIPRFMLTDPLHYFSSGASA